MPDLRPAGFNSSLKIAMEEIERRSRYSASQRAA
jgi:hypothetical protein